MEAIVSSALGGASNLYGSMSSLDENLQSLKRNIDELRCQADDIKGELELHPGKRRKKEVDNWLMNVEKIQGEVQRLEEEGVEEMSYIARAKLGKRVERKIEQVAELQQKGRFSSPLVLDAPPTSGHVIPTAKFFSSTTTGRNKEKVLENLMDDGVRRIGFYGIGGAGKTTIMQHIHNQLLKEPRFDKIIWVTVSKAFNVEKLQNEIAKAIKLDLSNDSDETLRASNLFAKLSTMKRYVLILDDLWEPFPLEKVGLVEPTGSNGCKLVITTRSLEVCRKMECTAVKVELLTKEEGLNLFMDTLGHSTVLAPEVKEIAKEVAKECKCLPLAIVTIGGSMRGVSDIHEWRNALNELTSSTKDIGDMEKEVFERLKFSYTRLKDQNLQNCFLYLALYPEDGRISKEELIKYWIAEGFIAEKESKQKMFDKGFTILNKLISVCLIEDINKYDCVKMHDLIREMALKIAGPRFLVRAGERFPEISDEDWSEDLERASFLDSEIEVLSRRSPNCPRLATLLLKWTGFVKIANSFFTHMRSLRVLDLSHTGIETMPISICELESLHILLVGGCRKLGKVASLKKMKALRELNLSGTGITELPQGVEELVNLQTLDLSWTWKLEIFRPWKLSKLSQLQFLRIVNSNVVISSDELMGLRKLRTLFVRFCNLQELGTYLLRFQQQFPKLEKYQLLLGLDGYFNPEEHAICKAVRIINREGGGGYVVNDLMLPSNIETFSIKECHDLISLSDILSLRNARDLRVCSVDKCSRLESIFSSSSSSSLEHSHIPLKSLENLDLTNLPNLRVLFGGVAPPSGVYCRLLSS